MDIYICIACQEKKKDEYIGVAGIKKHFKGGHLVQPDALRQAPQSTQYSCQVTCCSSLFLKDLQWWIIHV